MSDRISPKETKLGILPTRRFFDPWAKRALHRILDGIERGCLVMKDQEEERRFGDPCSEASMRAELTVLSPRFYGNVLLGGSIGAAEAYMAGWWTASDLATVVRILACNQEAVQKMDGGLALLTQPIHMAYHFLRPNTLKGSKRNIAAHYDLGNEFYAQFLDETLTYSCAVFESSDYDLAEASIAKYDRLCRKLQIGPSDHVIEIGTGWGGFAIHAAKTYGCHVTTTTISREQFGFANKRVQAAGLENQVEIHLKDYREISGKFDKFVSIEMIEAIGHKNIASYFRTCGRLLKPHGIAGIQAIVISDYAYSRYRRSADFIKRYIFPGGCLPSISEICRAVGRTTDMRLFDLEDITPHYCKTLSEWRARFVENAKEIRDMGFSEEFLRMWEYYLSYCEGAFAANYIGNVQMVFTKPAARRDPIHLPHPEFADTD